MSTTRPGAGATATRRVLVVDDAPATRLLVQRALEREGFAVDEAEDGRAALAALAERIPDAVLLDVVMPGLSGLEVLGRIRAHHPGLPVILLTGRDAEEDRVFGLDLGADDYLVKPFSVRELAARVRSVLRRCDLRRGLFDGDADGDGRTESVELRFGDLSIRRAERAVRIGDADVAVTAREFDLLAHLAAAPRRVFTREELLREVWGSSVEWQDPATVTEHIRRLRHKVEPDPDRPRWLHTVRGVGYRFNP